MTRLNWSHITGPRILIDARRARRNIERMQQKAVKLGVRLRPHFKTHQSVDIGRWFRDAGTHSIAVSSVSMAQQFEKAGWRDILIAIPLNPRELSAMNRLAGDCSLTVTIEHEDAIQVIQRFNHPVGVMVEIDAGYGRTGIDWQQKERIAALTLQLSTLPQVRDIGLMLHAGNSYQAHGDSEIATIHEQSLQRIAEVRSAISTNLSKPLWVSVGDTPTCSRMDTFPGVDEIRPGNYVFYDLMQQHIGACDWDDIALAVACPVIARYPERNEVVVHGGAVHFSKEFIEHDGQRCFGQVMVFNDQGWTAQPIAGAYLHSLSQEHGKVRVPTEMAGSLQLGDLLVIVPAHSCLTMAAMKEFTVFEPAFDPGI